MGFMDKIKFQFWDDVGAVVSLIEKWKPRKCESEKDYEESLYEHLHNHFGDLQITKQFAKGRIRADIVIADKVIVELKNNLDSTAKYQRLVGQLTQYKDWPGRVLVVLTGKTDKNLLTELKNYIKKEGLTGDLLGDKVTVIEK